MPFRAGVPEGSACLSSHPALGLQALTKVLVIWTQVPMLPQALQPTESSYRGCQQLVLVYSSRQRKTCYLVTTWIFLAHFGGWRVMCSPRKERRGKGNSWKKNQKWELLAIPYLTDICRKATYQALFKSAGDFLKRHILLSRELMVEEGMRVGAQQRDILHLLNPCC